MADIPGLIEGAHEGAGLGTRFLGHVERCRALLHLVDGTQDDVVGAYRTVRGELKAYGGNLARKKEIVALNKTDAMTAGGHRGQARAARQGEPQGGARDLRRLGPRRAAAAARADEAGRQAARPPRRKPRELAPALAGPPAGRQDRLRPPGRRDQGEIRRDWLEAWPTTSPRLHKGGCEVILVSSGAIASAARISSCRPARSSSRKAGRRRHRPDPARPRLAGGAGAARHHRGAGPADARRYRGAPPLPQRPRDHGHAAGHGPCR